MYNFLSAAVSVFFFLVNSRARSYSCALLTPQREGDTAAILFGELYCFFFNDYLFRHYFEVGEAERLLILHPRRSYCVMLRGT